MKLEKGYIQVYTGNGKGKTTAAIGLELRALGSGLKVYVVQFMKNYPYGEVKLLESISENLVLKRYGNDDFVFKKEPPAPELISEMKSGLAEAENAMISEAFDIIILDEILVSIYFKLFSTNELLNFLKKKPEQAEIILTGRYCPQEIIDLADLVTKMKEHKHYYQKGVKARRGIES